jgi:hypothetical protein
MDENRETHGLRGDELAEDATTEQLTTPTPEGTGIRGDGLARDAAGDTAVDAGELADGSPRGDGLAEESEPDD